MWMKSVEGIETAGLIENNKHNVVLGLTREITH